MASSNGDLPRASARRITQGLVPALTLAAMLLGPLAPATALASTISHAKWSGTANGPRTVSRTGHVSSLAAVAAVAAGQPRRAAGPRLRLGGVAAAGGGTMTPRTTPSTGPTGAAAAPRIVLTPDVAELNHWTGIPETDIGVLTPPDPWVAASPSFVVQVVNTEVKIWNRSGSPLVTVPTYDLFAVPAGHFASDARIIWDAHRSRWVGTLVWYLGDLSDNGLVIAVSDGPDPTLGWSMIFIGYGTDLPDYPSIASSSDKIVVADNLYNSLGNFLAADINTFTWSTILAGGVVGYHFCDASGYIHPRAAQVLTASNDVHLVMVDLNTTDQLYFRLVATGNCPATGTPDIRDGLDLTVALGHDALFSASGGPPPAPREVGPDTIDNAVDERFTDAVWQNNHLYWVSTFPATYDAGATWNDEVVVWGTTTNPTLGTTPTGEVKVEVRPGDGVDAFTGGIGLTGNGTPIVSYSQSDSADPVALYANRIDPGHTLGTPLLLDTGEAAITNERWGDFAGVAIDPVGNGAVWASHEVAASDGTWRTDVVRLVVDGDNPSIPGAPSIAAQTGTTLTLFPKYKLSWAAATDANSGVVSYRLEESIDGSGFFFTGAFSGTSTYRSLSPSDTYQFRVQSVDAFGKVSGFATTPVVHPVLYQSTTSRTGTWATSTSSGFSGGTAIYASAAGASATFTTTGVRSLAFVTTKAASRGSFKVYIDGVYKGTFSAYSTTTAFRQVVYQVNFSSAATHTIKIVVVGTSGHPRVDVDAFLVLK